MRLKSLKLAGFKSFANLTVFTFKHDITAIVGPNGCGKSNVIDAIRWVLGETSAKQLRGAAMSDVIFAGVEGRAAKSLASVELVFEHTQDETHGIRHELNLYQELSLRRQVTKEGKSDYFINGQRVRRRDVVDVFLGTGLGARSYAVIEQGMIGRIVDSSPMQLREFIEEGAGVSRYQARRAETEKKLIETKENLERLTDLQGELKRQHKTLLKQAQSAKEYQALSDELAKLHYDTLMKRLFDAWQLHELKKGDHGKSTEILSKLEAQVTKVRRELDALSAKVAEGQWLKDEARDNYHNAQMAEQAAQHNFYTINSQIAQNDEKIQRLTEQHAQALQNIEQSSQELSKIEASLAQMTPKAEEITQVVDEAKQALEQSQQQHQTQKDALAQLNLQNNTLQNQQKLAQLQSERIQANQQKWQKKSAELTQLAHSLAQTDDSEAQLKAQQAQIETLKLKLENLQDEEQKQAFDALNKQQQSLSSEVQNLEKRHATLLGEYEILHALVHAKPQNSDQKTSKNKGDAKLSAQAQALPSVQEVARLSDLGKPYADVLDVFFGFWLDAKMGEQLPWQMAQLNKPEQSALLRLTKAQKSTAGDLPKFIQDKCIAINQLIEQPTLALFERCYLYTDEPNDEFFEQLNQSDLAGVMLLTKTGWLLGNFGMLHISRFGEENGQFLAQRQAHIERLAELEEALSTLEDTLEAQQKTHKNQQKQLEALKISLEEQVAQRSSLVMQLHQAEQLVTKLNAKIDAKKIQQENLAKNRQDLDEEKAEMDKELAQLQQQMIDAADELQALAPKLSKLNQIIEKLKIQSEAQATTLKQHQQAQQSIQLEHNALVQNQAHSTRLLQMAQTSAQTTLADIEQTKLAQDKLQQKLPEAELVFKNAKSKTHELKIISEEHEAAAKVLQLGQTKLQDELTEAHTKFATAQAAAAQITADVAVGESRMQDIGDELLRANEKFNLPATLADFRANPNQSFSDHSERQAQIQQQISKLGAVNLAAAEELAELELRVSPMDAQITDITDSMNKLKDAIRAIDEKTKSLFLSTLSAVNKELNALFSKVFGGGQASLSLMEDDTLTKADKWRAGLVLMAQPKGKKNSRLAVLSGGEKTLTALSLIFAIFKQHPAPFCVLDEVDAPLDDANVARFTGLINELASSVQFIFISHNKLAMQIADELKGITMPTAGISSLVTVDLQEAEKYLESSLV